MNALFESIIARQQQIRAIAKSGHGYRVPIMRGIASPLGQDKLAYSTPDSLLVDSSIDEQKMTATFVVSTVAPDRDDDVVPPASCIKLLDNYRRNPVVFFGHQDIPLPIGSSESPTGEFCFWPDEQNGIITSTGHFHCKTPESHQIFGLIASKQLRAASLGFAPVEAERRFSRKGHDSGKRQSSGKGYLFLVIDVIEWSVVGVPMNSEAIAIGLSKGMLFGDKVSRVLHKALKPFAVPTTGAVRGGYNPHPTKETHMNLQSVKAFKGTFKAPAEAAAYIKGLGLDTSDMEEDADTYTFHQVPAEQCEDLKQGAVFKGVRHDNLQFVHYGIRTKDEAGSNPEAMPAEDAPPMPNGAMFLQDLSASLDGMLNHLNAHSGLLEHPPVKEACMKGIEELNGHRDALEDLKGEHYGDVDFGGGGDDVSEDDQTPAQKRYKCMCAKIAKAMGADEPLVNDPDAETPTGTPKLGPQFLDKAAQHLQTTHANIQAQMPALEHPVIKELATQLCKAIPARHGEITKMMKSEYPEDYKALGWDKNEEPPADDIAAADDNKSSDAPKDDAPVDDDDKDKDKEKGLDIRIKYKGRWLTVKQYAKSIDKEVPAPAEEEPAATGDDGVLGEVSRFLTEMAAKCGELAAKLGSSLDVGNNENPYMDTGTVTKGEEDEMTDDQMKQLMQSMEEVKAVSLAQKRQLSYMTGTSRH